MKNSIKNLKNYFQLIVTAVTCFMMGIVKERDSEQKKHMMEAEIEQEAE